MPSRRPGRANVMLPSTFGIGRGRAARLAPGGLDTIRCDATLAPNALRPWRTVPHAATVRRPGRRAPMAPGRQEALFALLLLRTV
ncbi:hypothetical protein BPA30113_02333 [Burkholderia paludis]|uniref:Uncharacterized protein n=1 Tax=Burkholderia paludis TaxID=1506587 RepID=A0A6J5DY39_9BURK|nr:hypothetical protein LMG30113_03391 [Burkholderia paludis]VWB53634.1 hypothetical protein BPA30113_02333 [Burkholderia paludis]